MDLKKTLLSVIVSLHTVAFASESATQRPTKSEQAITDPMEIEKAAKLQGQRVTDRFTELAKGLSEILVLEDAYAFAAALHNDLTKKADFSLLVSGHTTEAAPLVPALISVEKFRAFETQQGLLARSDPSPLDYYVPGAANMTSQAVLVSLATAIQKSLLNPKATAANLLDLVRHQKNSRSLKAIQPAMENLFTTGSINLLINEKLIEQIRKISLKISAIQKAVIGKEATSQQLITYKFPTFNQQKGTQDISALSFNHFGSSGMGNQCGFFSLGFASRQQAIEQIIDNLVENNIYVLADKISGTSAGLKVIMSRYISKKEAIPAHYLNLYAKAHSLGLHGEKLLEHLTAAYKKLETQLNAAENTINAEFEALKIKKGLPVRVPATDDGTIAHQISNLRQPFEHRKWIEQAKITQLFYPLADFQALIERNINEKFRNGMLEFDPNPEWEISVPTYPHIIALLNHYDIYSWVSASTFARMQQDGSAMMPLYQTPDERFVLTSFISGGENAIRVDILNTSGIHFEKWVSIHDDARLAKAIRHKKAYSLPNTQREHPTTTRKSSWFLGFF